MDEDGAVCVGNVDDEVFYAVDDVVEALFWVVELPWFYGGLHLSVYLYLIVKQHEPKKKRRRR